jgi:hypothetical protein
MTPNRTARRVYEARDVAKNYVETFKARPVEDEQKFNFSWPAELQCVGDSLAVAYASDKWKEKRGDDELYKHLAESRNRAFVAPGFLRDWDNTRKTWDVIGPMVSFATCPMPQHFAILGYFEEANLQLYVGGTDEEPEFGKKSEGIVTVEIRHAMLGASKILWEKDGEKKNQPFIFVYTESDGPLILITGKKLDIEKDGLTG